MLQWSLIWLFLGSSAGLAQDEPVATFDDLAEVKEVLLDVVAVDDSGLPVLGLGPDDFVVTEDGDEVQVTGVSFYASRYGVGDVVVEDPALAAVDAVPASRYFILVSHYPIGGGSIGDFVTRRQHRLRRDLLAWIGDHLLPSDWVAVVGYDVRLKIYQDFTQDRQALEDAVRQASTRRDPEKQYARGVRPLPPRGAPSLLRHLPSGRDLRRRSRRLEAGIELVAEAAGYIVGRKNLVLFSSGFGSLNSIDQVADPDLRYYEPMQQALNDQNIAVYAVDLTPLEIRHFQGGSLHRLALETGGAYFRDPTSFLNPLQRISKENIGYYLLSYQRQRPVSGGYQRVEVTTSRPGVKLRARTGYRYGRPEGDR